MGACERPFTREQEKKGIADAYYYMRKPDTKLFASNLYWPDRHWSLVMVPEAQHRFDFVNDDAV